MSTDDKLYADKEFTLNIPKPSYIIKFDKSGYACFYVHEPAKYPNAWYRFWLRFFLGWTIEKAAGSE